MKIAVAGTGYVGLSIATLLSQRNEVVAVDVIPEKVEKINRRESPIQDEYLEKYLAEKDLNLTATLDGRAAYADADFVVIAAPTNYDPKKNFFDTSHVEEVIDLVLQVNPDAVMVIKSTVPVGYTKAVREKFSYRERLADGTFRTITPKILFSPEFLRESKALYDNLYPSRIIVGYDEISSVISSGGAAGVEKSPRKVFLFADEFTNHQEAELGLTFARLLNRLGYVVEIPKHTESGRAAISKGCLRLAQKYAVKNVKLLKDRVSVETPLVGIEPSCILSFRDEYPDLVPPEMRSDAKKLAANCLLFDEFLVREFRAGHIGRDAFREVRADIWLHGHCHQKSLVGVGKSAEMLRMIPGATVHVIPSGCCGMAGSFGYEKEHYATSMAIGEMVLFPAVRRAGPEAIVSAPGTSCRQQILDGTGVRARHPVEVLYDCLK
jgi:Fe-S oxidoreductase